MGIKKEIGVDLQVLLACRTIEEELAIEASFLRGDLLMNQAVRQKTVAYNELRRQLEVPTQGVEPGK